MAGLTAQGFVAKTLLEIKAEMEADYRQGLGANIDLAPESPHGQEIGVAAEGFAEVWELSQAVYSAFDPDKNEGQAQDAVAAITGTIREEAAPSKVTLTATGTPATLLPAGRVASATGTGTRFATLADATIAALTAWAPTTAYFVGDRRTNASRAYVCITAGTSAGGGGPTTTAADITDGTVHWRYMGEGTGAVDAPSEAEEDGPFPAVSGTVTVIETPVSGWNGVVNLLDAVLGNLVEDDEDFRQRREDELFEAGSSTLDALRTDLLGVDGVTSALVFHNTSMLTDADGVPPKAVEALVQGGADADIRQALWDSGVAAGIETYGGVSGTVVDSSGTTQTVKFSRPSVQDVYVIIDVIKNPLLFPATGGDDIKAAIVAWGDALPVGQNVVSAAIASRAFTIPGVLDVTACKIGLAPAPTLETTIVITSRQLADYDTSRITVNLTDGTP